MSIAGIVLAAGRGTRFGQEPKMLARLAGKALVRHIVDTAVAADLSPVLVVVGHREDEVGAALAGLPITIVRNPAFADGLSTSLRAGFAALPATSEAAMILLGDMPLVHAGLVRRLAEAWAEASKPAALVPTFDGRRGNPVVLSRRLGPLIEDLAGDVGAGPLLRGHDDVVEIPVDDDSVLVDVDTRQTLERLGQV